MTVSKYTCALKFAIARLVTEQEKFYILLDSKLKSPFLLPLYSGSLTMAGFEDNPFAGDSENPFAVSNSSVNEIVFLSQEEHCRHAVVVGHFNSGTPNQVILTCWECLIFAGSIGSFSYE